MKKSPIPVPTNPEVPSHGQPVLLVFVYILPEIVYEYTSEYIYIYIFSSLSLSCFRNYLNTVLPFAFFT